MSNTRPRATRAAGLAGWFLACLSLMLSAAGAGEAADDGAPRTFRFVHISDTHCAHATTNPAGSDNLDAAYPKDLVNSFRILRAAVTDINKAIRPDFVIVTGDLVDTGNDTKSMREVKQILDKLRCPYYPVIGNHDGERAWTAVFGADKLNYTFKQGHWRFVVANSASGRLSATTLTWLKARLDKDTSTPTALLLHHPILLLPSSVAVYKSRYGRNPLLRNASEVLSIVRKHKNVRAVFCGHTHYPTQIGYGRLALCVAGALAAPGHRMFVVSVKGVTVKRAYTSVLP